MEKKQIFYCEPLELLTPLRFDISAKHYYAKHRNIKSNFPLDLYKHHIDVWNGFSEYDNPNKQDQAGFINEFNSIIDSIGTNGFNNEESLIPVSEKFKSPLNGAHRIAASILHKKKVACYNAPEESGQLNCSYYFFNSRKEHVLAGLDGDYADFMALNYAKLKKNTFMVTLFPAAMSRFQEARNIIFNSTKVVYEKAVKLEGWGPFNFIKTLYDGEEWAGNWKVGFQGLVSKVNQCYTPHGSTYIFLVEIDEAQNLRAIKEQVRSLYNVGNHSIHINDYHKETVRIASAVFNKNSIHFLNNTEPKYLNNFEIYFKKYRQWVSNSDEDTDNFCIDSSAVLSAYGLRDCRDLDFLYSGQHIDSEIYKIDCHNEELKYYLHDKDDIIFNPQNHFYHVGLKFANLDVIKKMKQNRSESKDLIDIELINRIWS